MVKQPSPLGARGYGEAGSEGLFHEADRPVPVTPLFPQRWFFRKLPVAPKCPSPAPVGSE